jgi:hypothetical protein
MLVKVPNKRVRPFRTCPSMDRAVRAKAAKYSDDSADGGGDRDDSEPYSAGMQTVFVSKATKKPHREGAPARWFWGPFDVHAWAYMRHGKLHNDNGPAWVAAPGPVGANEPAPILRPFVVPPRLPSVADAVGVAYARDGRFIDPMPGHVPAIWMQSCVKEVAVFCDAMGDVHRDLHLGPAIIINGVSLSDHPTHKLRLGVRAWVVHGVVVVVQEVVVDVDSVIQTYVWTRVLNAGSHWVAPPTLSNAVPDIKLLREPFQPAEVIACTDACTGSAEHWPMLPAGVHQLPSAVVPLWTLRNRRAACAELSHLASLRWYWITVVALCSRGKR